MTDQPTDPPPSAMRVYRPEEAAPLLRLTPCALRARCRRGARRRGRDVAAELGGGIVAFKMGRSWRVRFPS